MNENRINLAGREIAFRASEGTGRPVILVHGNSCSSRAWSPLLHGGFGERFRCLALDLPGHGDSAPAEDPELYSAPEFAAVLVDFAKATDAEDAVVVGWSMGGHIVLEAAPTLPEAAGFVLFGTPPVSDPADLTRGFLPNPAMAVGFQADVDLDAARTYAENFLAPGSTVSTDEFVEDILRTDGAARAHLFASIQAGRLADEIEIVAQLRRPLAVLHGELDRLISLDYLRSLTMPTLWRGTVQVLPGIGHAPQAEAPRDFADLLAQFLTDVG